MLHALNEFTLLSMYPTHITKYKKEMLFLLVSPVGYIQLSHTKNALKLPLALFQAQ